MFHGKLPRLGTGDSFDSSPNELLEPPIDTFHLFLFMQSDNHLNIKMTHQKPLLAVNQFETINW